MDKLCSNSLDLSYQYYYIIIPTKLIDSTLNLLNYAKFVLYCAATDFLTSIAVAQYRLNF